MRPLALQRKIRMQKSQMKATIIEWLWLIAILTLCWTW